MAAPATRRERLQAMLADLKMPGALEALDSILAGLDGGRLTGPEALESLLDAQIQEELHLRLSPCIGPSRPAPATPVRPREPARPERSGTLEAGINQRTPLPLRPD